MEPPGYAYANSLPNQNSLYPDEQHTFAFFIKCVTPVELAVVVVVVNIALEEHLVWVVSYPGR